MKIVVATHGHCFDGMCSAFMFTRLMQHLHPSSPARGPLEFRYVSCGYGAGESGVDTTCFDGDVHAVLDYRFTQSPRLTWYFDHHVSAFQGAGDLAAYEAMAQEPERRAFHDGAYSSCTKLIADIGLERFGLDSSADAELIRWADLIDAARFPSAKMAVERKEPVMKLMTVLERHGDGDFLGEMVTRLSKASLEEVCASEDIGAMFEPLGRVHDEVVAMVTERAREKRGVVLVDLTSEIVASSGKFVTYALYPESTFSVTVSRDETSCKISIGYNPWSPFPRRHNVAAICERHGGGGHPVVGGIALPAGEIDRARRLAESIAEELSD